MFKNFKKMLVGVFTLVFFAVFSNYPLAFSVPSGKENFKGIDISFWNKDIDWKKVKESGQVQFAIIRTSFGWSNREKFTDSKLKNNIKGAKSVGIPIGAYHYSYAINCQEAIWEADFFIDRLKWAKWEYPVCMDIEDKCQLKLNNDERTNIIITFLDRVEKAGYYAAFYTNLNWTKKFLDLKRLSRFDLWIAQWHKECNCERPYGIWQYTSKGNIPGIEGNVDLDISYVNYPKIIKERHLNGF